MCGRYYRRGQKQELAERMRAGVIDPGIPDLIEHYNIAPTTWQPVVRHTRDGGERELVNMRWGLVPFFAKSLDAFKGFSTFNAKCEDILAKLTWRGPMERGRRFLIPADGFYEWKVLDPEAKKPDEQPYAFTVHARRLGLSPSDITFAVNIARRRACQLESTLASNVWPTCESSSIGARSCSN